MATLSVAFILLRSLRRFLEQCAATEVEISGLNDTVRTYLHEALALRFDLDHTEHDDGSLRLRLRFPVSVLDAESGRLVKIGSARRKMAAVIERDGPGCVWCGQALSYSHPQATLDHVLPHSADGSQEVGNMLIACKRCNHTRRSTPAESWLERCLAKGMAVNEQAVRQAILRVNTEPLLRRAERRAEQAAGMAAA